MSRKKERDRKSQSAEELLVLLTTGLVIMDIKSGHPSPVMTDSPQISNSRLTVRQSRPPHSSSSSQNNNLLLTVPRKKTGIIDDVKANAWFDAMIASSPTPALVNKDNDATTTDMTYREWTVCPLLCILSLVNFSEHHSLVFYPLIYVSVLAGQVSISSYYF